MKVLSKNWEKQQDKDTQRFRLSWQRKVKDKTKTMHWSSHFLFLFLPILLLYTHLCILTPLTRRPIWRKLILAGFSLCGLIFVLMIFPDWLTLWSVWAGRGGELQNCCSLDLDEIKLLYFEDNVTSVVIPSWVSAGYQRALKCPLHFFPQKTCKNLYISALLL